jgi:hypothetical protein
VRNIFAGSHTEHHWRCSDDILSFTTLALSCLQAKPLQVVTAHLILVKLPLKLRWTSLIRIPLGDQKRNFREKVRLLYQFDFLFLKPFFGLSAA